MYVIRKAAVLGAGLMGTAVAAQLANAGIPTLLLDLPPTEIAENSIKAAATGRPAAFAHPSRQRLLTPGNFDDDLGKLADVDWILEAVIEDLGIKTDLLRRVAEHVSDHAIITTNSSGLSVNDMAAALPESLRHRFFGAHFFNPPRYMYRSSSSPASTPTAPSLTRSGSSPPCGEAVGRDETLGAAMAAVARGGTVAVVGAFERSAEIPIARLTGRSMTLRMCLGNFAHMTALMDLVASGRLDMSSLITHRLPLEDAARAYELVDRRMERVVKVLSYPGGGRPA